MLVGNIDLNKLKPFILTYLGGLPADRHSKPGYNEQNFTTPQGPNEYVFKKGGDNKANVNLKFVTPAKWDKTTDYNYSAFIDILNSRLYESLRIEMSGVYGVHISGELNRLHEPEASLNIAFGTNTEAYEKLYERTLSEIKKLIDEGPSPAEIERVKEKKRVALDTQLKQNAAWLLKIYYAYRYEEPVESEAGMKAQIESLSAESIREAWKRCIDTGTPLKFLLLPDN